MPDNLDFDALARQSECLRIGFIECELELCGTFIALGHAESLGDLPHARRILQILERAIDTTHHFIAQVSSIDEQARFVEQLAKIEDTAGELKALVEGVGHNPSFPALFSRNKLPPRECTVSPSAPTDARSGS